MNKLMILGFVLILIISMLTGCNEQNKFVGEWKDQDGDSHHFFSDNTFNTISGSITQSGTWELKDNKMVITVPVGSIIYSFSFSNNDKTLTLSGLKTLILTKV